MDQRKYFYAPDFKDRDKETEDMPTKTGKMGSSDDLLEEQEEGAEELIHGAGALTTPQAVKLPRISNTALIANSSSN